MAKTYLEIVKYMVAAKFTIDGVVDKPDIIGAVFGQTEGLLGNELDLRELQKNGKIGRIEIEVSQSSNKTFGKLFLPASLDRIETCILAAAVESVDRVGPYEAHFGVEKVEDTRSEKRRKILNRAKELVRILLSTELPDSKEISEMVQMDVRASEVTTYGPEALPAGPDIAKSDEVIIVEGRADVLTLLKNDITNAIAVGGATSTIPPSIIKLANEKESTLFMDGDRGGELILRTLTNATEIDFVARAPDGKEVEDLTRKEIIKAMRSRIPLEQYPGYRFMKKGVVSPENAKPQYRPTPPMPNFQQRPPTPPPPPPPSQPQSQPRPEPVQEERMARPGIEAVEADDDIQSIDASEVLVPDVRSKADKPALESMLLTQLSGGLNELAGTLRSRLYDNAGNVVKEIPIRELLVELQDSNGVYGVVLDGVLTQRLVELAAQKGVKALYGIRANPLTKKYSDMILYTKEQGKL